MSGRKVLVAGGTGFVGSQAVKLFERLGYQVTVISRKEPVDTAKTPSLLVDRQDGLLQLPQSLLKALQDLHHPAGKSLALTALLLQPG